MSEDKEHEADAKDETRDQEVAVEPDPVLGALFRSTSQQTRKTNLNSAFASHYRHTEEEI